MKYVCFALGSCLKLLQLLRKEHFDVVHFHTALAAACGLNIAKRYSIPVVYSLHTPLVGIVTDRDGETSAEAVHLQGMSKIVELASGSLESCVVRHADRIIVTSDKLKQTIVERYYSDPSRIEVIPYGVDTNLFRPGVSSTELRQQYGLNLDNSVIMCVSSIEPRKNQLSLVKALAEVAAVIPDVKVMLVGRTSDPAYLEEIQSYTRDNHLLDKVLFTGHIEHHLLPQYYNLCDVFVSLSLAEAGLPLVLSEAMSCHKAVVAAALPQYTEIANQDDEFFVVDPFDACAISRLLLSVLKHDRKKTPSTSTKGTKQALHDWRGNAARTAEVYRNL